jgi:hypothetical protein
MNNMKKLLSKLFQNHSSENLTSPFSKGSGSLEKDAKENIKVIKEVLGGSSDLIIRNIKIGEHERIEIAHV